MKLGINNRNKAEKFTKLSSILFNHGPKKTITREIRKYLKRYMKTKMTQQNL
jgi:hypothetical protein